MERRCRMTQPYRRGNLSIGPLGAGGTAKHYQPKRIVFAPSDRVCNSAVTEPYVPQDRTVYRPGSVDSSRPRVRGV